MTFRNILLAAAVAAGLIVAPTAFAADAPRSLQVLTPEQVDPARLIPPPPADGSDLQKAQLAEVKQIYVARSPERLAQAQWDDKHETSELFFATLGPQFDLAKLPATAKLLARVENEQSVAATIAKRYFKRSRPWALDASIVACDYKPGAPTQTSYPSGHSMLGYSVGYVLAQLMPEKAQPILARARDYAFSRVVCGAHYQSDTEASHVLATALVMAMMENPGFAAQFRTARAELRAAQLTN